MKNESVSRQVLQPRLSGNASTRNIPVAENPILFTIAGLVAMTTISRLQPGGLP